MVNILSLPLTMIFSIILLLWILSRIKAHLFWMYLWQLKNYHIGRFLAHFSTSAGRQAIFNKTIFIKIILLFGIGYIACALNPKPVLFWLLPITFFVYAFEGLYSLFSFLKARAKLPEFTSKVIFLLPIVFIPLGVISTVFFLFIFNKFPQFGAYDILFTGTIFSLATLAFDILTPLIVSLIVLLFQPVTVILRNRIIKRAIKKRQSLENLTVIGITGSFGKSSVKEFLKTILGVSFKVVSTEKNKNSEIGISETILGQVNEEHEIFICEMGAYNRGGIKLLCDIAGPKIGILTGIGNQHLATFGSQTNLIKAKFELINALPEEGLAVLNWDSRLIRENFKEDKNSMKYGLEKQEDIWAEDINIGKFSVSFDAVFKTKDKIKVQVGLIGGQNIVNLLAAIGLAKRLGMENEEILRGIGNIRAKQGGLDAVKTKQNFYLANSSYSMNINGANAHLDYLKVWDTQKIFVMPCLIELGADAKQAHYELGKKIGKVCDYLIVTTNDYFKQIKKGAIESGMSASKIFLIQNAESQYKKITALASAGDIVFLEGRVSDYLVNKLNA
ncbi:MAG: UDP-N-acetylmuramoyl-tripeptide--D-alanyl-D-alanine ligase [Candidatus Paceibacterota bacterium]